MHRVFLSSPWVPVEMIRAFGLEPCGAWFSEKLGDSSAAAAGTCGFANAWFRLMSLEPGAAFVFTTQCDQLRRSFDAIPSVQRERAFLFNVPATWQSPVALRMYESELNRLWNFLAGIGGRQPSEKGFADAITAANQRRGALLDAGARASAKDFLRLLEGYFGKEGAVPAGARPGRGVAGSVPLALLGGPLPQTHWPILDTIEQLGGRVVLVATEPGERNLWETDGGGALASNGREALIAGLAHSYVDHIVDACQRPNSRLYSWLGERLRLRGVRGILLWHYTWCDHWRAEAQTIKSAFKLPVLQFDADTLAAPTLRKTGRLEAFMESLR